MMGDVECEPSDLHTGKRVQSGSLHRCDRMSNARLRAESGSRLSTFPIYNPAATHGDG